MASRPRVKRPQRPADQVREEPVRPYRVHDWYWSVAGDDGFVWSSKRRARVAIDDADYKQHRADGGGATSIDSMESLRWVWERGGIVQDDAEQYDLARRQRYEAELPIGDQLDALRKQVSALVDFVDVLQAHVNGPRGEPLAPEFKALIDKVAEIKAALPKPAPSSGGSDG